MTARDTMIGEKNPSDSIGLTVVSLKEHFDDKLKAMEKTTEMRVAISDAKICNLEKDTRHLLSFQSSQEGKASQNALIMTLIIAVVSLLTGLSSILIALVK